MKALKIILGILVALFVIYLIACALGPKNMNSSASAEIAAPADVVYSQFADLKNWEAWSPWKKMDPTMAITYGEKTSGVGGSYSWTGEKTGAGNLEIIETVPNQSMKTKLTFEGWDGESFGNWAVEPGENGGSNVSWGFEGSDIPFMFRGMMFSAPKTLNKQLNEGLSGIKAIAEEMGSAPANSYRGYEINSVTFPAKTYVGIRDKVQMDNIADFFGKCFGAIVTACNSGGMEMAGAPSGLYYEWDVENGVSDMAAAIPVSSASDVKGKMAAINIDEGDALLIDYYGAYDKSAEAHYAMEDYMKANSLSMSGPVIEEYVTDPTEEPDTSKWLTKIYYLVSSN